MLNQKSLSSCLIYVSHAKILANIENLKESKQSLFLLTRITFEIPENEPLAYENLEEFFFLRKEIWTRKILKREGVEELKWQIKLSTTDIAIN